MKTTTRKRMLRAATGGLFLVLTGMAVAARPAPAQEPEAACPADRWAGWLGISALSCSRCTISSVSATERDWSFATEPEITRVDSESPAADVLRAGDRLVGIDGHLITSREGGRRFGSVGPGDEVTLRYRRGGEIRSSTFTAAGRCMAGDLPDAPDAPDAPLPTVENSLERLGDPLPPAGRAPRPPLPDVLPGPGSPEAPPLPSLPHGGAYLGLSFRCGDCTARLQGDRVAWRFSEPPRIEVVDPDGPAAQAGLQEGDRILAVDGAPIESPEGGRSFGRMVPGDTVRLTVSRADESTTDISLSPTQGPRSRASGDPPRPEAPEVERFRGNLGPARVTVTGAPVSVLKDQGAGLLIIRTRDNEIRIQLPATGGGGQP